MIRRKCYRSPIREADGPASRPSSRVRVISRHLGGLVCDRFGRMPDIPYRCKGQFRSRSIVHHRDADPQEEDAAQSDPSCSSRGPQACGKSLRFT